MSASSAPPSPDCASSMLLLQSRRLDGDSRRWRTLLRFRPQQLSQAHALAMLAMQLDPGVTWRITRLAGGLFP